MPCFAVIVGVILKRGVASVISPYLPVIMLSLLKRSNQGVGNEQVCDLHRGHEKTSSEILKKLKGEEPPAGSRHLD
jgi:hypothetical protein